MFSAKATHVDSKNAFESAVFLNAHRFKKNALLWFEGVKTEIMKDCSPLFNLLMHVFIKVWTNANSNVVHLQINSKFALFSSFRPITSES